MRAAAQIKPSQEELAATGEEGAGGLAEQEQGDEQQQGHRQGGDNALPAREPGRVRGVNAGGRQVSAQVAGRLGNAKCAWGGGGAAVEASVGMLRVIDHHKSSCADCQLVVSPQVCPPLLCVRASVCVCVRARACADMCACVLRACTAC